ncbi:hypothetical protein GSF22_30190 [Micromonospora echinofusca]|uniref:Uncharacterized protein n=1 Tax=Micromonospora echinofusca TaxID=47858 RepID=A0ABS3W0B0_MICEH|nr:hypothetical protein [Micromonospora echinofusca]
MSLRVPRPGDVVLVDGRASVQFAGARGFLFRVISVSDQPTYHGWAWLTGYLLDRTGQATGKREIFVQPAGLRQVSDTSPSPRHGDIRRQSYIKRSRT